MSVDVAVRCNPIVQRAWEDCETFERNITAVELDAAIENTDISFYELFEAPRRVFFARNVTIERLLVQRRQGQTSLYFQFDAPLKMNRRIGAFTDHYFGADVFCEFAPSSPQSDE